MKQFSLLSLLFLLLFVTFGQIPVNYYANAEGKQNNELKAALSVIITNGYNQRSYDQLWTDFYTTDDRPDGTVWDMYSNCTFTFGTHQDHGTGGGKECEFYNREHSIPNSWFGGKNYPMYSDLFHLYPTDKYVNNQRDNFPFGETNGGATYGNGSKRGNGTAESGYTGTVFEPIDEYKGDFARTYFYMTTRYPNTNLSQTEHGEVVFTYTNSKSDLTNYAINLFLKWHRNDPVSEKETDRNNTVYDIQKNRNPFIDYPELAEYIWGNHQNEAWYTNPQGVSETTLPAIKITRYNNGIHIEGAQPNAQVEIYSILGQNVYTTRLSSDFLPLEHLKQGFYIVKVGGCAQKMVW